MTPIEQIIKSAADLRAEAIAIGQQVTLAKVEGKTMRIMFDMRRKPRAKRKGRK